jgi:acyl-CoA thioesterase-1
VDVKVGNAGVTGDTSEGALKRLDEVLRAQPKLVIVALGANDIFRNVPRETLHRNLLSIVQTLQAHGISVILVGLETDDVKTDYARALRGMYERIAEEEKVALVPFMLKGVFGNPELLAADGMHPNGKGYRVVAQNILPSVLSFFREKGLPRMP